MTTSFKLDDTKNQVSMGLIVLQTDETIENEFRSILGKNFKLYHSRIPSHQKVTPKNLLLANANPVLSILEVVHPVIFPVVNFVTLQKV